jgi:hypothetical protein
MPNQPDFGKLRQIAKTAEKDKPLTMGRWQALMRDAQKACGDIGFLTEFLVAYYPGKIGS